MAYYDRLVENPDAALKDIAARRDLSADELLARVDNVYAEAQSGKHLSLGEATRWLEAPEGASDELRSHIDSCRYCQAVLDGLAPQRLRENVGRLQTEMTRRRSISRLSAAVGRGIRSYGVPVGVALAAGFAAALIVVPNTFNHRALLGGATLSSAPAATAGAASPAEIGGIVSASCTLVRTAGNSATIVCFKPRSERNLQVKVASNTDDGRWILTSALAGSQDRGANTPAVGGAQPFFAHNALRPGDEVFLFKPQKSRSGDSAKAVADSLAALKESLNVNSKGGAGAPMPQ